MNRVELVGRLTANPEIKKAKSGNDICDFTIAVNRIKKVEGQPDADFIQCRAFSSTATFMYNYLKKGFLISVEGKIQTSTSGEGNERKYYTTVICESVQNLTPREKEGMSEERVSEVTGKCEELGLDISSDDLPF